ncbi:portal protein [Sphingomonas sp. SAFR-052]|uniref:portal protein n=1 Tax=Sphingomonas sp. SAFR-052 TaxID=3436867 RepID=UPI003F8087FB
MDTDTALDQDAAPASDKLREVHSRAIARFDDTVLPQLEMRAEALMARRFVSIPGAMWEGPWGEQFENSIKVEIPKVKNGIRKIENDYRQNRIVPDFRPSGGASDQDTGGGKAMRQGDADKLEKQVSTVTALRSALSGFKDDFGGNTLTGETENWLQVLTGLGTTGQRDWWSNFRATDNLIRNELFGASLTDGEKKAYDATTVTPRMAPSEIRRNLQRRVRIAETALARRVARLKAAGFNSDEIDAATGGVAAGGIATVRTKQEAMRLAPGTLYRAPDGKVRRR